MFNSFTPAPSCYGALEVEISINQEFIRADARAQGSGILDPLVEGPGLLAHHLPHDSEGPSLAMFLEH